MMQEKAACCGNGREKARRRRTSTGFFMNVCRMREARFPRPNAVYGVTRRS